MAATLAAATHGLYNRPHHEHRRPLLSGVRRFLHKIEHRFSDDSDDEISSTSRRGSASSATTAASPREDAGFALVHRRAKKLGFRVVKMKDDGNCLFRSIAHQLWGDEERYPEVRTAVIRYMQQNAQDFACYFPDAELFEKYLARMSKDRTWGDEYCVLAASLAFSVQINIVSSSQGKNWHMQFPEERTGRPQIFIGYVQGLHYDSLISA